MKRRMRLFGKTNLPTLERVMSQGAWRQRAHASNVANASTPGYKRLEARFCDELDRIGGPTLGLETTNPNHLGPMAAAENSTETCVVPAADGRETVDLDQEMVALAENQLVFDLAARVANLRIAGIRASILGRK